MELSHEMLFNNLCILFCFISIHVIVPLIFIEIVRFV